MKINKELLSRLYKEYNELYFDGKLGKCDFAIFPKSNPSFGWYNGRDGKNGKPNDKIWIGTCIKWNKEKLKIVMIHIICFVETQSFRVGRKQNITFY